MGNARRPIFELHIRPMFRLLDQVHMLRLQAARRIDLYDYQQVRDKHQRIHEMIADASPMPTPGTGGPWPQEWIDLFGRWKDTGFGRLEQPVASGLRLVLTAPDRYTLTCAVTLPHANALAWFDVIKAQSDAQIFALVMEAAEGPPPAPAVATVEERIRGPLSVVEVVVIDGAGEHRFSLPTS